MAPLVRTGGSRHAGLAALPHRNIHYTRKSRKYSSYKGKVGTVAPNRIRRRFNTNIPHQKITTDTTEFKYYEVDAKGHVTMQKLYLDPFMDMCNGEMKSLQTVLTGELFTLIKDGLLR